MNSVGPSEVLPKVVLIACLPRQTPPCNQERAFRKDPEERKANLDDRRKIVAELTSVTGRPLKIPGDRMEINGECVLI